MKEKFKRKGPFFYVLLLVLTLGCSVEEEATHTGRKAFTTKTISYIEFINETGLSNFETSITILPKSTDFQGRTADGKYELTDFDIDTDVIKSMEFQQKITYSLKIQPKDTISENFFNLIVYKKDNVWEKLIIEMKPTPENLNQLQNGFTDNFVGQMRKLYDSSPPVMNACVTITITSYHCTGCEGPCNCSGSCCVSTVTFNSCDFGGTVPSGGGPGSPSGPSGPGGGIGDGSWDNGTGGSTPSPDDIVIEPNLDPTSINSLGQTPANPCNKIKSKTSSTAYLNKFNNLNTFDKFNLDHETGFYEKKVNGATMYYDGIASNTHQLTIPNNITGFTHVHNNKFDPDNSTLDLSVKMFSPADLLKLITSCRNTATIEGNALDAYGIMISNSGIFGITIVDPNINLQFVDDNWANFLIDYDKQVDRILKNTSFSSVDRSGALQKMMLQFMKNLGLENNVALFEGNSISNRVNWSRKSLDNSSNLATVPCI